jgi:outer membrane protein TolC
MSPAGLVVRSVRRHLPWTAALAGVLIAGRGAVAGQAVPAAPVAGTPLTLAEALDLAERNNPGYRQAANELERNDIDRRGLWLQILPRPSVSVLNTGIAWNLQRVGTDNFGNPVPNPEPRMVQSSRSQQVASLGLQLDFRNLLRWRQQGVQAESREVNAASELQTLRSTVRRAFLDAQERQVTVDLEVELLEVQRRNQEAATRLFALARRERLDVLEAELEVIAQDEVVRQARASLTNALLALRNAIGDSELEITAVEPVPMREVDPARLDEEALVRTALESSPRIRQQQAQIQLAQRQVNVVRSQWLPTLRFNVNTGRTELDRGGGGAFFQPNPSSDWDRNISLDLTFPDIGRHFEVQNDGRSQQLTVRNQQEVLRQVRLDVEEGVRSVLVGLRSDHGSLDLQERRAELSQERLDLQLESYRLGRGTFMDLQNASQAAASVQRTLLQRRYQLERALVNLEQTLGMPFERIVELGGS